MRRRPTLLACLATAFVAAIAAAGPAPGASSVTITFSELDEGTVVTSQYADQGVRFGTEDDFGIKLSHAFACGAPTVRTTIPDEVTARKAAQAPVCDGRSGVLAAFDGPRRHVSALLWTERPREGRSAELRAYDSSGDLVGRAGPVDLGFNPVEISLDRDRAEIAYVAIQLTDEGDEALVVDDLSFDAVEETLQASGRDFTATAGVDARAVVAHFTDSGTDPKPGDFAIRIDWGDGTIGDGDVQAAGDGFDVSASHAYAAAGTYAVSTQIRKADGQIGRAHV